jgi:hypothetical protein
LIVLIAFLSFYIILIFLPFCNTAFFAPLKRKKTAPHKTAGLNGKSGLTLFAAAAGAFGFRHKAIRPADLIAVSLGAMLYRAVPAVGPLVHAILFQIIQVVSQKVHNAAPPRRKLLFLML